MGHGQSYDHEVGRICPGHLPLAICHHSRIQSGAIGVFWSDPRLGWFVRPRSQTRDPGRTATSQNMESEYNSKRGRSALWLRKPRTLFPPMMDGLSSGNALPFLWRRKAIRCLKENVPLNVSAQCGPLERKRLVSSGLLNVVGRYKYSAYSPRSSKRSTQHGRSF